MKWKARRIPKEGDERWTLRFAFLPQRCNDGYVRWLCDLYVRQVYYSYGELAGASWVTVEASHRAPWQIAGLQGGQKE